MIALVIGTLLAIGALAFVLAPLFAAEVAPPEGARDADARPAEPAASARAVEVLREIEFDRATGKLSDEDYAELKSTWTGRAVAAMRAEEAGAAAAPAHAASDEELEARIRKYRQAAPSTPSGPAAAPACPTCGPRPEPDAVYCSRCGLFLAGACGRCGAEIREPGAHFCTSCGGRIGAAMPAARESTRSASTAHA